MVNHPNRKRTYPDHTLENAARAAGVRVVVLWEMRGPANTAVDWMGGYQIDHLPVIVQTYTDGDGWNVFAPNSTNDVDRTIAEILKVCAEV